MHKNMSLMMRT